MKRLTFLLWMSLVAITVTASDHLCLVVGTYTGTGSHGIYTFDFDQSTGLFRTLDSLALRDPSYLALARGGRMVYAVSERPDSTASLSAIRLNPRTGRLALVNAQPTGGADPCYVEVRGRMALTANYTGGSMSVFPIRADGSLAPRRQLFLGHAAGGPAPQDVPHIHAARFLDGATILVSDFSADQLLRLRTDGTRVWGDGVAGKLRSGSAPRHIAWSRDRRIVYVMSEVGGTVTVFRRTRGVLGEVQVVASDSVGGHGGADLHLTPDGRFLYASNRLKADGISVFRVDRHSGRLTKVGYQLTGLHPRNFHITPNGRYLLCACRDSDRIEVYRRDPRTGLLTLTGSIGVKRPVCVQFAIP